MKHRLQLPQQRMGRGVAGLGVVPALLVIAVLLSAGVARAAGAGLAHNVIIFVADGLRAGSVTAADAPTMTALRAHAVSFTNSHSLFPTFTTPNAAAIATGHYLGDTGDFSNSLYVGYPLFDTGNFGHAAAGSIPFIENDAVLGDLDDHFEGNFLGESSLLALARAAGFSTAAIGKIGPTAIQDVGELEPAKRAFTVPQTIIIDDATGAEAPPLGEELQLALDSAGLPRTTPPRVQPAGDSTTPGTRVANWAQQSYFIDVTTRVVLPLFERRHRPFALVYWSRDPDGTQHNQGDSLNRLSPGINGATSRMAVRHADQDLGRILDYLHAHPALAATTDVVVTSDHGFATISKHDLDAAGHATASPAAAGHYPDVPAGFLPPGFLAIDLASLLHEPLYDPDSPVQDAQGNTLYQRVVGGPPSDARLERAHPRGGNALIGGTGRAGAHGDAELIVAANGGSDLIYLPQADPARVRQVVGLLSGLDYVGALFVDDPFGPLPGALPLSSIALKGAAHLPVPTIVVAFRTFELDPKQAASKDPLQDAVLIADTPLQQGQGMHGGFGRDNTFNFMVATGPDFKSRFRDPLPAGNADIEPTLAQILGLAGGAQGTLQGRVLREALRGTPVPRGRAEQCVAISHATEDGHATLLAYQRYDGRLYFDQAAFRISTAADLSGCR